jgi:PBP1b-binding outer membrane lipoprotein LpoB
MKLIIQSSIIALTVFLVSCATPVGYTEKELSRYDKNTTYRVDERADGFTVTMYYSRYQFIPESDAVLASAKSNLTAICYDVADSKGKEIKQINEQRIKMSMGRNGLSGITSWTGSVKAFYK